MAIDYSSEFSDVVNDSYLMGEVTVGTSQVQMKVGANNLECREILRIYNNSSNTIYVGPSGVTTTGSTKGEPVRKGGWIEFPIGDNLDVYAIADSAGNSILVQEFA